MRTNDQLNEFPKPLKGLKILITDLDLQQSEHRGIAMYSKSIIKALKASGAETWLLTDLDPHISDPGLSRLPENIKRIIYSARVMEGLVSGHGGLKSNYWNSKLAKAPRLRGLYLKLLKLRDKCDQLIPRRYKLSKSNRVFLHNQEDSPYLRQERLSYFADLDGIVCARYLYLNATRKTLSRSPKSLKVKLGNDFDCLVTTCPLNLSTVEKGRCLQTIHDLIPLEYVPHLDNVANFAHRLANCVSSRKLFVSSVTRKKFEFAYSNKLDPGGEVVIQPPSLTIPETSRKILLEQTIPNQSFLQTVSIKSQQKAPQRFSRKLFEINSNQRSKKYSNELKPFQYILFNSSVEPRKKFTLRDQSF